MYEFLYLTPPPSFFSALSTISYDYLYLLLIFYSPTPFQIHSFAKRGRTNKLSRNFNANRMKPTPRTSSQPKRITHINIRQSIFQGITDNLYTSLKLLFFHKEAADGTGRFIPATKSNVHFLPHSDTWKSEAAVPCGSAMKTHPKPPPLLSSHNALLLLRRMFPPLPNLVFGPHPRTPSFCFTFPRLYFTQYPHPIYTSSEGCKRTTFSHKCPIN